MAEDGLRTTEVRNDPAPWDLLFTGGTVLCMDSALTRYDPGYVAVRGGRILEVGPWPPVGAEQCSAQSPRSGPFPLSADGPSIARPLRQTQEIDCTDCLILPGLINCHTHLPMVAFRGLADDLPLMEWLTKHIWPAEARQLSPQFCYDATRLASAECIRGGVTCVNDMYLFERDIARALADCGLRGIVGEGVIQYPTPSAKTWQDGRQLTRELLDEYAGHTLIEPSVTCHAPYSCTPEILQTMHALAVERGALFHIHLHETATEPEHIAWLEPGETPTAGLARLGLLGPRTLAAHCVWCNAADIALLAQHGCGVAHDPQSNLKLASGVMPLAAMLQAGVAIGIATDGAASNNNLNLWEELQLAALLAKGFGFMERGSTDPLPADAALKSRAPQEKTGARLAPLPQNDARLVPAAQAVALATREAARALGRTDIGVLAPGMRADLIVVDTNTPHLTPRYPHPDAVYSLLAYSAQASDVRDTCVEGRLLMRNRQLLTLDEREVMAQVQRLIQ